MVSLQNGDTLGEGGLGLKLTKIWRFFRASDVLFVLGAQKYNQNNLATLLNFSDLTNFRFFSGIIWSSD